MIQNPLIAMVHAYRYLIRPFLTPSCRFYPSCSQYSIEALSTHGMLKGSQLTLKRICRCHPFNLGGIDLVPQKKK